MASGCPPGKSLLFLLWQLANSVQVVHSQLGQLLANSYTFTVGDPVVGITTSGTPRQCFSVAVLTLQSLLVFVATMFDFQLGTASFACGTRC